MTLDLQVNRIGSEGAKYLANALQHNKVSFVCFLIYPNRFNYSAQTITIIDFQCNKIGDEGAKYFANALEYNRVK